MNEWKHFPENKHLLVDDENYLVSFVDSEGDFMMMHRAYWSSSEQNFFSLEIYHSMALRVDIFMEMPHLPRFKI